MAVGAKVLEIYGPIRLPDRAAGLLVERDDELVVAAVEVEEKQVAIEDRRGAGAAEVIALNVASRPKHPAGLRVEAGRARGTERRVEPACFDDRCGRGIAIEGDAVLRFGDVEQLQVLKDAASAGIDADSEELLAVGRGCR